MSTWGIGKCQRKKSPAGVRDGEEIWALAARGVRGDKLERLGVGGGVLASWGVRDKEGKGEVEARSWMVKAWRRVISQVSWGSRLRGT